jgi:hypothetical protein
MHRLRNPPTRRLWGFSAASPMEPNETAGPNVSAQFLRLGAWSTPLWRQD